jgi:hypothetical protein
MAESLQLDGPCIIPSRRQQVNGSPFLKSPKRNREALKVSA